MLQSRARILTLIFIGLGALSSKPLLGASVTLDWQPNTEPDLAGYKLFYGQASGEYQAVLEAGMDTTITLVGLLEQTTYYFALKAFDTWGNESDFSEEIFHTVQESGDEGLSLITPDGGENLVPASLFEIQWEADTTIAKIRIWLSSDAGRSWELVKGNTGNDGHWTWTIPQTRSDSCLMKLEEYRNPARFDVSADYFSIGETTGIGGDSQVGVPKSVALGQNFPNPFNPVTTITFSVPAAASGDVQSKVSIAVYDSRGRKVTDLIKGTLPPGNHSVVWDGRTERGEIAPSGVYFYALRVGGEALPPRKMLLAR